MAVELKDLVLFHPQKGGTAQQILQEAAKKGLRPLTEDEMNQLLQMENSTPVVHNTKPNLVFRDGKWIWDDGQDTGWNPDQEFPFFP